MQTTNANHVTQDLSLIPLSQHVLTHLNKFALQIKSEIHVILAKLALVDKYQTSKEINVWPLLLQLDQVAHVINS